MNGTAARTPRVSPQATQEARGEEANQYIGSVQINDRFRRVEAGGIYDSVLLAQCPWVATGKQKNTSKYVVEGVKLIPL